MKTFASTGKTVSFCFCTSLAWHLDCFYVIEMESNENENMTKHLDGHDWDLCHNMNNFLALYTSQYFV